MKMTEYYAQHPNLYTGTANVSISLHTIDFDGWQLPLTLSYNATGIRTAQEASEVGLGWSLNATGIISRTVRGGDDFYLGGVGDGRGRGYVYNTKPVPVAEPFNIGYDPFTPPVPPQPDPDSYYSYLANERPDTQPDIFSYNFFGYSGQFVLSQKVSDPVPIQDQKIYAIKLAEDATRIVFNETPNKTFTITTPEGFKGDFTAKELSTSLSNSRNVTGDAAACGEDQINFVFLQNESGQLRVISSWYLTKITSPRGKEIVFNYDLDANGNSLFLSNDRTFGEDEAQAAQLPLCMQNIHELVYLKNIAYNNNVNIEFLMEEREDLRKNELFTPSSIAVNLFPFSQNLKRYSRISITGLGPASTFNKSVVFSQTYFNQQYHNKLANDENELIWLRSRLDRLTIDDKEHNFTYYKGTKGLPQKQTRAIDHFGFYNGQDQNKNLFWPIVVEGVPATCFSNSTAVLHYRPDYVRYVDFNYGQSALLKKVTYPTKGYSLFEYEQHTYAPDQMGKFIEVNGGIAGGARIKSIKEFDFIDNLLRQRSYRYTQNGEIDLINPAPSSGLLMTPLLNLGRARLAIQPITNEDCLFLLQSNSSIPGNNAAEGKIIGYSTVHEIVEGGGNSYKNSYFFENIPNTVFTTLLAVEGYPNVNGQVKEVRNLNKDGKVVQRSENANYKDLVAGWIRGVDYKPVQINLTTSLRYWQDYKIKKTFTTPTLIKTTTSESSGGFTIDPLTGINNLDGLTSVSQKKLEYANSFLLKAQEITGSNGDVVRTEFTRPLDYTTPSSGITYMKNINLVEPIIEEIVKRNGSVISASGNRFELQNANQINLTATFSYNKVIGSLASFNPSTDGYAFVSPYEKRVDFTKYAGQNNGKLLEYVGSDGVVNSFVWGYGGELLIAHGVGIGYDQLNAAHLATDFNSPNYDLSLRSHPDLLGKQVVTYIHDPHVGILKFTDAAGLKKTFQYGSYGRLNKILDNSNKTLEQYQYHFRERKPTRIMNLSGNINFGTLTPDMFSTQFLPYERCSDPIRTKVLTISNSGEDDLQVASVTVPTGFKSSWNGGIIPPNESVDVIISFIGNTLGNYSGNIVINSNRTNVVSDATVSALYANRVCNVSIAPVTGANPKIFDFGTSSGSVFGQYIDITNNGNAAFRLLAAPLDWNGSGTNYSTFTHPDFNVAASFSIGGPNAPTNGFCIGVGETYRLAVNFTPQIGPNGLRSTKLSLITDIDNIDTNACPTLKDVVTLQGNIQRPLSTISMDTSPIVFDNFTEAFKTKTLTIANTGTLGFTVSGLSFSNPALASQFTLIPPSFLALPIVVSAGQSLDFVLKFQPPSLDVPVSTNITINNDAMVGNETIAFSGNRRSFRQIILSTSTTNNELLFDNQFDTRPITITNSSQSNDNLSVTGFSPANTSLQFFQVSSFTSGSLGIGQSMTMQVFRTGAIPANTEVITVLSNKTDGVDSFTPKGQTRIIALSISSIAFPAFSTPSISQSITVSNTGNAALTISSVSSSNAMFTISPATLTIPVGGQQTVTVTFTPTAFNFSQQTGTITLSGNQQPSGTSTISVSGQRTASRTIQLSANSLIYDLTLQQQTVTITNIGNDYLNVTGVNNPNTQDWTASIANAYLAPAQSTNLAISRLINPNPQTTNISVLSNKNSGNEVVQVSANTRTIGLSTNNIVFPSFSAPSINQSVTVTNSGNSTLSVNSISSTNSMFAVLPSTLTIPAGGQQTVTITFNPAAFDFNQQTGTITFSGDQTGGANTIVISGQRTSLRTIALSASSLVFDFTGQTQYVTVSNSGNDNLNITGVSYPATPNWSASITPTVLAPGQSTNLSIVKTNGTVELLNISVLSNKNGGNEFVQVTFNLPPTRIINLSGVTFPSFTATSSSQNLTVSNSGNSTLTVTGVSSSNSRFTISSGSFSIPPGGQQTVSVTYTPTDFSQQSSTISFSSDASGGSGSTSVTAQRAQLAQLSVFPTSVSIKPSTPSATVFITNTGNVGATISSINNNSTANFSATYFTGGFPTSVPVVLQPGQQMQIQVSTVGSNYNSANATLTIFNSVTSPYIINLSRSLF